MKHPKIGDVVDVVGNEHYAGHWGIVVRTDVANDEYFVSAGSIGTGAPMFGRSELRVRAVAESPARSAGNTRKARK